MEGTLLLVALFVTLFGGAITDMLAGVGMLQVYLATGLAVFLVLLAATLAMHSLSPRLATIAEVENEVDATPPTPRRHLKVTPPSQAMDISKLASRGGGDDALASPFGYC